MTGLNVTALEGAKTHEDAMSDAFPDVEAGLIPYGSRVLVQIRTPKTVSEGGIILHDETRETDKWNAQVAKVIMLGPVAFKNRESLEPWPEGDWCQAGEFVRVPKYGGDRWEIPVPGSQDPALFVLFNDLDLLGQFTGNPLDVKAFI